MPTPVLYRSKLHLATALVLATAASRPLAAEPAAPAGAVEAGPVAPAAVEAGPVAPAPIPEGEPIDREPMPVPDPLGVSEPAPPPGAGLPAAGDSWIDSTHSFLGSVFGTVLRFDRFFSDEREFDLERGQSFVRWRNEVRYGDDDFTFRTTLRADLRLPGLNRVLSRLRLVVTGESEDTLSELFPEGTGPRRGETGRGNAELRYGIVDTLRTHFDLGGGVLFRLPPGVRARARLRHAFPATGSVLVRLGNTAFWESDVGFGDTVQVDFERRFSRNTVVRWQNGATISESSLGWEWATGAALLQGLGRRSAIALGGSIDGWTEPFPEVTRRRLFLRFRRDVFRSWLFYELEPEVLWPVVDGRTQPEVLGIIGRLEIQFQGTTLMGR